MESQTTKTGPTEKCYNQETNNFVNEITFLITLLELNINKK